MYAFISTLTSTFYKSINKLIWVVLLIFLPVSAIVYPFIGKQQTEEGKDFKIGSELFMISSFIFMYIKNYLGFTKDDHFGLIGSIIGTFIIALIISALIGLFSVLVKKNNKDIKYQNFDDVQIAKAQERKRIEKEKVSRANELTKQENNL